MSRFVPLCILSLCNILLQGTLRGMSKRRTKGYKPGQIRPREVLSGHRGSDRRLTEFECEGCHRLRSLQKFFEGQPSYDPRDRPALCNDCGRRGRHLPDSVNASDTLTVSHRKALRVLLDPVNNSVKEAARCSGLSESKVRSLMQGTLKPEFRKVFQLELAAQGLTLQQLAHNLAESTRAVKRQWNPATQQWDEFEDNGVQFQATRHAIKLLDMEPKDEKGGVGIAIINLQTNLGEQGPRHDPPGVYTIEKGNGKSE